MHDQLQNISGRDAPRISAPPPCLIKAGGNSKEIIHRQVYSRSACFAASNEIYATHARLKGFHILCFTLFGGKRIRVLLISTCEHNVL